LILNEIYTALYLQKQNGHFILKVFDVFTSTSIHLLYLLNIMYKEIYIYKPKTSRPSNSERYIICKYFKSTVEGIDNYLTQLQVLSKTLKKEKLNSKYISFTLFNEIPNSFIEKIKIMNKELTNIQCNCLIQSIELCNNNEFLNKYDKILKDNLEKRNNVFKLWIKQYDLQI
jgi:cap1 methyltransferase